MNQKLKYLGILAILPVFTLALTFDNAEAKTTIAKSELSKQLIRAKICGDHLCSEPASKSTKNMMQDKMMQDKMMQDKMMQDKMMQDKMMQDKMMGKEKMMGTSEMQAPGSVLKLSNANLPLVIPLVQGLYDGKDVFYISTEASDPDVAKMLTEFTGFPVTYAPTIAKSPDTGLANIFVFKNGIKGSGVLGFQPNVVDSIPGKPEYSALWKINFVEWKDASKATVLGSDNDIAKAVEDGLVTLTPTKVVVNCPIVQWSGDSEGTIPAGHMKIKDDKTLTNETPYGGGQVLDIDIKNMKITFVAHRGFGSDGSTIYYIVTDASMKDPANMMGVIFTEKTGSLVVSSASSDLYQFANGIKGTGPMGFQAGIGSTKPGDAAYSPMWRISMITWKDASNATVLENMHDINTLSKEFDIAPAGMVVNCPFFSADTVFAHTK